MKHNAKLFIANKEVDCNESLSLPITYSLEDLKNPTIVKNAFSKTISIPATKNNNKIFGEIYKLDRMQHYEDWTGNPQLNGINFDPSKRVDFAIYVNGEIVESGYCQLNDVSIQNEIKAYNITLYGGLGDFFYNLKYNENGQKKTLADLQYFIEDEQGNVLDKDKEMTFTINKELVNECYSKNWDTDGNRLSDTITFIPAYNGTYDNFDSSHCLINTNGDNVFPKILYDRSSSPAKEYTPFNGYGYADLNQDYNEWEMRDLRSYQQRPAIKVSKLIEAICREENSGYQVSFDKSFFNKKNPYWYKSFVALPLLGTTAEDAEVSSYAIASPEASNLHIGHSYYGANPILSDATHINVNGQDITTQNGIIDMSAFPISSTFDMNLDFSLAAIPQDEVSGDTLYIAGRYGYQIYERDVYYYFDHPQAISAQAIAYDADTNNIIGYSNIYYFTNIIQGSSYISSPDNWIEYTPSTNAEGVRILGSFKRNNDKFYFLSDNGNDTFRLTLNNITRTDRVKILLYINWHRSNTDCLYGLFDSPAVLDPPNERGISTQEVVELVTENDFEISYGNPILSGATITKDMILKTESSPADFLLSYTKMFGLYYVKDVNEKKITIYSRPNYFRTDVHNWDDRIDRSKNITINPILFNTKWYLMSLETPETYFASKYQDKYDMTYGQKRLSTGYNFNSDTTPLFEDNVFQNTITAIDSDRYYRSFYNDNENLVPCFVNDNITYSLYKGEESFGSDIYGYGNINPSRTVNWTSMGKDIFPKQCFFSMNGDSKDLEEITASLVFYNGTVDCKDAKGNDVTFWITDDLMEMSVLNDGEMCYLYTASENDVNGNRIAIAKTSLPQYISYLTNEDGTVNSSLDFGLPKEIYTNYKYSEESTIFNKYWEQFLFDQFNINTKKVTCYVRLDDIKVNDDLLRDFYYFDNSYWMLNKIDSYDVNSTATVRCEFIKVQEIKNYRSGIANGSLSTSGIKNQLDTEVYTFPKDSSNFTYFLEYTSSSSIANVTIDYGQILQVTDNQIIFFVSNNSSNTDRTVTITATNEEGITVSLSILQLGYKIVINSDGSLDYTELPDHNGEPIDPPIKRDPNPII